MKMSGKPKFWSFSSLSASQIIIIYFCISLLFGSGPRFVESNTGAQEFDDLSQVLYPGSACNVFGNVESSTVVWPEGICIPIKENGETVGYFKVECQGNLTTPNAQQNVIRQYYNASEKFCVNPNSTEISQDGACISNNLTLSGVTFFSYEWKCSRGFSLSPNVLSLLTVIVFTIALVFNLFIDDFGLN